MTTMPHSIPRQTSQGRNHIPPLEPHMSVPGLLAVYVALMLLLAGTALTSFFEIGAWSIVVALIIAVAKAVLVVLFFMHVRFARPVTRVFVCMGFVWLAILFGLSLSDFLTRMWAPHMDDLAPQQQLFPTPPGITPRELSSPNQRIHFEPSPGAASGG